MMGYAYAGGRWRRPEQRMNYVRLRRVALALWAIAARISEFGFSPNKTAALGLNLLLLVNLAWSAVLYAVNICSLKRSATNSLKNIKKLEQRGTR
jgi:hypothetical protein